MSREVNGLYSFLFEYFYRKYPPEKKRLIF